MENRAGIEPQNSIFSMSQRLVGVPEKNGIDSCEYLADPLVQAVWRSPAVNEAKAKISRFDNLFIRQLVPDVMVIHVSGYSLEGVTLQIIEQLDSFPVSEMDYHVGIIAELGA